MKKRCISPSKGRSHKTALLAEKRPEHLLARNQTFQKHLLASHMFGISGFSRVGVGLFLGGLLSLKHVLAGHFFIHDHPFIKNKICWLCGTAWFSIWVQSWIWYWYPFKDFGELDYLCTLSPRKFTRGCRCICILCKMMHYYVLVPLIAFDGPASWLSLRIPNSSQAGEGGTGSQLGSWFWPDFGEGQRHWDDHVPMGRRS